ncbi:hypothetical protein BDV59DRAFT_162775 [Aspergillus ambiguus]|uniref:uncharacterized protein n=1 Tax=Aspergillus ambiguus TaxID=176160 RepID=UPI003CCE2059
MVTLEDLLPKIQGRLSMMELYTLAITLTTSVLQLSPTPWLDSLVCKRDIAFLRANDRSYTSVDLHHPYLIHRHSLGTSGGGDERRRANDCSNLLALAIMLLEINSARHIETLHCTEDFGPNCEVTELTDLSAARRWLGEQKNRGNVSCAFFSAIAYCLQSFVNPQALLRDQKFCKAVEEQVLAPLEEEMRFLLLGDM